MEGTIILSVITTGRFWSEVRAGAGNVWTSTFTKGTMRWENWIYVRCYISPESNSDPCRVARLFLIFPQQVKNAYTLQKTTTSERVISFAQLITHGWGIETWYRKAFSGIQNLPPSIIVHSEFFPCGSLRSSSPAYADR